MTLHPFGIAVPPLPTVGVLLVVAAALHVIPDLTRPDIFFGVIVEPPFRRSELARGIRRRYRVVIWAATAVAVALAAAANAPLTAWVVQGAAALWAIIRAHRATVVHAIPHSTVVQVELSPPPEGARTLVAVLSVPLVSLAILAAWAATHWEELPSRLPVHWSLQGPDRWVATSPAAVAALLGLYALVCLLLALIAWGVRHGSRRIATAGEPARAEHRLRVGSVRLLTVVEYVIVFPAWAALLVLPPLAVQAWLIGTLALLLGLTVSLVLAGQSGPRSAARGGGTMVGDRTDDRYWTWGLFYFNRDDPAFLVEKRFGIGYTFNFGHPLSWVAIAVLAAILLLGRLL